MTPIYLNPPPSPFPQTVEKEAIDQVFDHHHHHLLFTTTTTTTSSPTSQASSSSSLTFPIFFNPTQDQGGINYDHIDQEQELNKYLFHGGSSSSDHHQFLPIPSHDPTPSVLLPTVESTDHHRHGTGNNNYGGLQFSIMSCKQEEMIIKAESCQIENGSSSSSVKWMSSKMRLMRKMMNPDRPRIIVESSTTQKFQQDQDQPISPNSNNNSTIRVCSDCNTTKTPLWRSGPRGPKSLCNACGIRQRKARRAMAAAAAAANGTILASTTTDHTSSSSMRTTTTADNKGQQPYKKRCKITAPRSKKKICIEDLTINLNKNSDFQRVFPQDEKEAAILLMALSCGPCGLVHG